MEKKNNKSEFIAIRYPNQINWRNPQNNVYLVPLMEVHPFIIGL